MEEWKTIEGYDGRYEVSSHGRIRSVSMFLGNHIYHGKVLSPTIATNGYLKVNLILRGKKKTCLVHRLVAKAFIPNPLNLEMVNHKDENRQNNFVENLEWCDRNYNNNYGSHNEKIAKSKSKPIIQYDLNGNIVREWESASVAARTLGCAQSGINWCCLRKPKHNTCIGFIWRFADDKDTRYKNGKSIIKYDCNGNFIEEYINITSAAKENKICITSITNCAKGRSKTAGGFKWEYKHV